MFKELLVLKKYLSFDSLKKNRNKGSGLITTLVGVSFMLILAAIIMTISFANVQMKMIDYRNQRNFYRNETGINDVYSGLGRDISAKLTKSYSEVLSQINSAESIDLESDATRAVEQNKYYARFTGRFHNELDLLLAGKVLTDLDTDLSSDTDAHDHLYALLNSYISDASANRNTRVLDIGSIVKDAENTDADRVKLTRYTLKDVTINYTEDRSTEESENTNAFISTVTTDIVIDIPYIYFFNDFSRVADFAMIGNRGIYFNNAEYEVEGGMYAGVHLDNSGNRDVAAFDANYTGYQYGNLPSTFDGASSETQAYDGLNLYQSTVTLKGGDVVSKGDINICESTLKTDPAPSTDTVGTSHTAIWAENIRTVEDGSLSPTSQYTRLSYLAGKKPGASITTPPVLDVRGDFYIADDLELSAEQSDVTLAGNYYGYNYNNGTSNMYDTKETDALQGKYGGAVDHTTSSSIVVNANESKLDINRLDTMLLSGLASIDVSDPTITYSEDEKIVTEYKTGESLAARFNQSLYLAPGTIMLKQNPKIIPDGQPQPSLESMCPARNATVDPERNGWFGWKYVNNTSPVRAITMKMGGTTAVYYMLNFQDTVMEGGVSVDAEQAYIRFVLNANPAYPEEQEAAKLRQEIEQRKTGMFSALDGSPSGYIKGQTSTSIVTNGYLSLTEGDTLLMNQNMGSAVTVALSAKSMGEQQWNMVRILAPFNTLTGKEKDLADETSPDYVGEAQLPAELFVNYAETVGTNNVWSGVSDSYRELRSGSVVIIKNFNASDPYGDPEPVKLSTVLASHSAATDSFSGIVLAKGNVEIDCEVEGLVISSGKIFVTGGGSGKAIKANSSLVSAIVSEEQKNLMSISLSGSDATTYNQSLASYYFQATHSFVKEADESYVDVEDRVLSTNYTDYIYFKNWHKGQ